MNVATGQSVVMTHIVEEKDLATNWRNDVPVLATPILLWLSEIACMKAIEQEISTDMMTVGYSHHSRHQAASSLGEEVTITATLTRVENKKLCFDVVAHDTNGEIFKGEHERFLIDKNKFLEKLSKKERRNG
ncbi:hypothetical protein F0342_11835 [Bacillus sp. CH30_1T]|uniref:thioesterase family protein n=1 Tax=Bacillus sp. CH30_1T TaxID=2604836 RepID=UPI0011F04379|nr:hotdog domain-containing protein [Bacillus sp. CH30_1T]KAA0563503.1 hypothetical protein F0342_11835 [Bacillus sp. CH30_1T]